MSPPRLLVLDSNSIISPNQRRLFSQTFERQLKECRSLAVFTVAIPRVALSEVAFKRVNQFEKTLKDLKKGSEDLAALLGTQERLGFLTVNTLRRTLHRRCLAWCKENGIAILRVPLHAINWRNMVRNSVMRRPPFSTGTSEKGFRDAIILETLMVEVGRDPKIKPILISNDELLVAAAQARCPTLEAIKDMETLLSELRLERAHIEDARLRLFTETASQLFFDVSNPNCLFYRENVREQALRKAPKTMREAKWRNPFTLSIYANYGNPIRKGEESVVVEESLYQRTDQWGRHYWQARVFLHYIIEFKIIAIEYSLPRVLVAAYMANWSAIESDTGFIEERVDSVEYEFSVIAESSEEAISRG